MAKDTSYYQIQDETAIFRRRRSNVKAKTKEGEAWKGWVETTEKYETLKDVSVMVSQLDTGNENTVDHIREQIQLHLDTAFPSSEFTLSKSDIKIKSNALQ